MNLDAQSLNRLLVDHPVSSHHSGSGMDFVAFVASVLPCLPGAHVVVSTRHPKGSAFPREWLLSSMVGIFWEGQMWVGGEGVSNEAFKERMVLQTTGDAAIHSKSPGMVVIARAFSAPRRFMVWRSRDFRWNIPPGSQEYRLMASASVFRRCSWHSRSC